MNAITRGRKRSIGEVLAALKDEFSDISISKIRFLETQGLIEPERTASGYRKFADDDVARLRYILRLQREQFLPLKVIKERLDEHVANAAASGKSADEMPSANPFSALITRRDLLSEAGLQEAQLRDLEKFSMIKGESTANGVYYDADALAMARAAAQLLHTGIEVRHLRMFKVAVDREADLYRQMAPPEQSAKSPQAKAEARARREEIAEIGDAMRRELLRQALS